MTLEINLDVEDAYAQLYRVMHLKQIREANEADLSLAWRVVDEAKAMRGRTH